MDSKGFERFTMNHYVPLAVSFACVYKMFRRNSVAKLENYARVLSNEILVAERMKGSYSLSDIKLTARGAQINNSVEMQHRLERFQSRIPKLGSYKSVFLNTSMLVQFLLTGKYLVVCLLDLESFAGYRYLDCVLVGRQTWGAVSAAYMKYVALFVNTSFLLYRILSNIINLGFQLDCLDFIYYDYDEIFETEVCEANEHGLLENNKLSRAENAKIESYSALPRRLSNRMLIEIQEQSQPIANSATVINFSPILHARNQSTTRDDPVGELIILRPNRLSLSWLKYRHITNISCIISVITLSSAYLIFLIVGTGVLLTRRGFELSYMNCVRWIIEQDRANKTLPYYKQAYQVRPNEVLIEKQSELFVALQNFSPFNEYHTLRLLADLIENAFCIGIFIASLTGTIYINMLTVFDILVYIGALNESTERLISALKTHLVTTTGRQLVQCGSDHRHQVDKIQTLAIDLFRMIGRYNRHASFYLLLFTILFSFLTAVSGNVMFSQTSGLSDFKFEWYVLQTVLTMVLVIIICSLALVKVRSMVLYNRICTLMALDKDYRHTKLKWTMLLRMYFPRPLNCFSVFRTTKVTHFLCLKLITWMLSIVLVIGNLRLGSFSSIARTSAEEWPLMWQ